MNPTRKFSPAGLLIALLGIILALGMTGPASAMVPTDATSASASTMDCDNTTFTASFTAVAASVSQASSAPTHSDCTPPVEVTPVAPVTTPESCTADGSVTIPKQPDKGVTGAQVNDKLLQRSDLPKTFGPGTHVIRYKYVKGAHVTVTLPTTITVNKRWTCSTEVKPDCYKFDGAVKTNCYALHNAAKLTMVNGKSTGGVTFCWKVYDRSGNKVAKRSDCTGTSVSANTSRTKVLRDLKRGWTVKLFARGDLLGKGVVRNKCRTPGEPGTGQRGAPTVGKATAA